MERIREAVERARATDRPSEIQSGVVKMARQQQITSDAVRPVIRTPEAASSIPENEIEASTVCLEANRVIAYNGADQRSRPYDMLRTQILQSMAVAGWRILGITSATAGCGKTLTAVNLAFSIARQPEQSVVIIDLDFQKPQVAAVLGLSFPGGGALDVVEGRASLAGTALAVRAGRQRITVLPTSATTESSELMASRAMREFLTEVKKTYPSGTIIVDLPPILTSDDVIAILPQIDSVLLVAAVGRSKVAEIQECSRHLQSSHIVRVVVNKTTDPASNYQYY